MESSTSLDDAAPTEYLHQREKNIRKRMLSRANLPKRRKRMGNHVNAAIFRESLYENTRHSSSIGATGCNTLHTTVSIFQTRVTVSNRFSDAPFTARIGDKRLLVNSA
jgi:hypothetical protein